MMSVVNGYLNKAHEKLDQAADADTDVANQLWLMRGAMLEVIAALEAATGQTGKLTTDDNVRAQIRESRSLSRRALTALKKADAALTEALTWKRTYYAPGEAEAYRSVEIARRKIRRLMKPGQFVEEDESATGDDGAEGPAGKLIAASLMGHIFTTLAKAIDGEDGEQIGGAE